MSNAPDGRAYIAGWIIKLAAGAMLTASLGWASWTTNLNTKQETTIAVMDSRLSRMNAQLERIEDKLDVALQRPSPIRR
jgi:hypothetical protein